jgi:hypothetical protein
MLGQQAGLAGRSGSRSVMLRDMHVARAQARACPYDLGPRSMRAWPRCQDMFAEISAYGKHLVLLG